ncbi:MAG: hypothetical protein SFX73_24900 [Kofleriaceae bacterium]|nr:hypothetical protein [Kofleriaceae bacterium]
MRWLSMLLLAGCLPDVVDDAVVVKGKFVTVHTPPQIPVCEDAVAVADRFVEDAAAMFGVSPPAIDYYVFDGPTGCGYGKYATASCAMYRTVYANHWIHFHELVHAVDASHPPALFAEGLAEALSIPSPTARNQPLRTDAALPFESSAFRTGDVAEHYRIAGDFVRYIIERFGPEKYRELSISLMSLADELTTRSTFRQVMGISLDETIADFRATTPARSVLRVPVDLADCHDPIPPTERDTWVFEDITTNDCTSGMTENGTSYWQHTRRFGFEITNAGVYEIEVAASGDAKRGRMWSCAAGEVFEYASARQAKHLTVVPLVKGRHAIEALDDTTGFRITRLGHIGDKCERATPISVPPNERWQLEVSGTPSSWVRIDNPGPRPLYGTVRTASPALACTGPCNALRCQPLGSSVPLIYGAGEPLYVHFGGSGQELQRVLVESED